MQTEAAHLGAERGGYITDHTTHNEVLDGMTVGTTHGGDMLSEESFPLVYLSLVAAIHTPIMFLPCHSSVMLYAAKLLKNFTSCNIFNEKVG